MRGIVREEGNLRRATALAFRQGEYDVGAGFAHTISLYFKRSGRVGDHARWSNWVQTRMNKAVGESKWVTELDHAWGLFLEGRGQGAVSLLHHQLCEIERILPETRKTYVDLCQTLFHVITQDQPIPPQIQEVIAQLLAAHEPNPAIGRFLQALTQGTIPDPP